MGWQEVGRDLVEETVTLLSVSKIEFVKQPESTLVIFFKPRAAVVF